jgi:hypothetical protein
LLDDADDMDPECLPRKGTTPIVRVDGDALVYFMWVAWPCGRWDGLMLRCGKEGTVLAALRPSPEACNRYERV